MKNTINNSETGGVSAQRERLRTPSALVNDAVTRLTGKALAGQAPAVRMSETGYLAFTATVLLTSFVFLVWAADEFVNALDGWAAVQWTPTIIIGQAILVGQLRVLQVGHAHYAVHRSYANGNATINRWIAEFCTLIPISQNPIDYRDDHVRRHHPRHIFTSIEDPDAALLAQLGFLPRMSRSQLWKRLFATLFSPTFHVWFIWVRFSSNFVGTSSRRKLLVITWLFTLCVIGIATGPWVALIAIVLPMTLLYQMSALLQFLTEHRWMSGCFEAKDYQAYADRSHARVAIAPLPPADLHGPKKLKAWAVWGIRQGGEILFRLSVTVGDLTVHDFHHVHGLCGHRVTNWSEMAFERQKCIDAGDKLRLQDRETMGCVAALNWVFEGLNENHESINTVGEEI